jgi:hypothetical protein
MIPLPAQLLPLAGPVLPAAPEAPRLAAPRRRGGMLGLVWIHGHFEAAVFHRQQAGGAWTSLQPVATLAQFEGALAAALAALGFEGGETFLVLEHDEFVHQSEGAPAFSREAAQAYLKGRVQRYEREHERVVWVGEKTHTGRQDATFILHLLPAKFYDRLNQILLSHKLDLTRIVPLSVSLQQVIQSAAPTATLPILLAAEAGRGTTILVAVPGGDLVFARIIRASSREEPDRVAGEINRSLLYAKQQFGIAVEQVWLLNGGPVAAEVEARCGGVRQIVNRELTPIDWLQAVLRLPANHPVNLVAGYLRRKRRQQFARRALVAASWLALVLAALDSYSARDARQAERVHFAAVRAQAAAHRAEHNRLATRNDQLSRDEALLQHWADDRTPPVPSRFLRYLTTLLSPDMRLTNFVVVADGAGPGWTFHLEGTVEGDADAASDAVTALEQHLARSPLHVRLNNGARTVTSVPPASGSADNPVEHFTLEGGLFEN